jgi:hypothetical protein
MLSLLKKCCENTRDQTWEYVELPYVTGRFVFFTPDRIVNGDGIVQFVFAIDLVLICGLRFRRVTKPQRESSGQSRRGKK